MHFSLWWWGCKEGNKEAKTEEGEWVEAGVRRLEGSILAEDCPLSAHCVPCFMCGAVSTWQKWMNNLTQWLEIKKVDVKLKQQWLLSNWISFNFNTTWYRSVNVINKRWLGILMTTFPVHNYCKNIIRICSIYDGLFMQSCFDNHATQCRGEWLGPVSS